MGGGTPKDQTTTTTNKSVTRGSGTSSGTVSGETTGRQDVNLPEYLRPFMQGIPELTADQFASIGQDVSGFEIDPAAYEQALGTARGDYLYGGPAMDAFVQGAQRAALPTINSQFRGGRGLAQAAYDQAGLDAYARVYEGERGRQLQAAQMLPQFQQLPIQLKNMLLQNTLSVPNAFASLFGQRTRGTSDVESDQQYQNISRTRGSGTQTVPLYGGDPLTGGLGGAMTGMQLGSIFGTPGMLAGAGIGGLLGAI